MQIIGAGVGRTGTYSLKLAINELGFGPCHHMEAVAENMPVQVPLWSAAVNGEPDWPSIYDGFPSAVDWPTASFYGELLEAYPDAKFILTHRSPESWADSFGATIYTMLSKRSTFPHEMSLWLDMALSVISKAGFPLGLDRDQLIAGFQSHNEAVKNTIPAKQLLIFEVKEGWRPLCDFLGVPIPAEPFPHTNDRQEFCDRFGN